MEALFFGMGIALLPVYAFESGSVQFAHILLFIFVAIRLTHQTLGLMWAERLLIILVIVVFAREGIAGVAGTSSGSSLIHAAYLAFNTAIVVAVARIPLQNWTFRSSLKLGLAASVAVATGGIWYYGSGLVLVGGELQRSVGLFNNPNQLGYFAVCLTSIVGLLYLRGVVSRTACLGFWAIAAFLVVVSLSRAALLGFIPAIVIGLAAFLNRGRLTPVVFLTAVTLMFGVGLAYAGGLFDEFQFVERLEATGSGRYDRLVERGYSLDFDGPLEFLFGSGATLARIGSYGQHEIHSTIWSFMAKYGFVGFALFVGVLVMWAKTLYRDHGVLGISLVLLPPMMFGLTHNGSRFTALWVLIGLSLNRSTRLASQSKQSPLPQQNVPAAAPRFEGVRTFSSAPQSVGPTCQRP